MENKKMTLIESENKENGWFSETLTLESYKTRSIRVMCDVSRFNAITTPF